MVLIYNVFIFLYGLAIRLAAPFNKKAKLWVKGRDGLINNISKVVKPTDEIIWFHCASLGEFEQARPLIEQIKKELPNKKTCITFFSPSGYEVSKDYDLADYVFYLPLDTKRNAKAFISAINPEKVFFIKYEVWYNFYKQLYVSSIPTYLVSANFREQQRFFKWYGSLFRKALKFCTHIFIQSEISAQLLKTINVSNYSVAGDTRYDRVWSISTNAKKIAEIEAFKNELPLIILGSSWPVEERLIAEYSSKNNQKQKIIIAPHEVSEAHLKYIEKLFQNSTVRFSNWNNNSKEKVMIIDNIGMLSSLYQYADIALVGGGFTGKLHNILEPAAHGCPVLFGPKYQKHPEAIELIKNGIAYCISSPSDLEEKINLLLSDKAPSRSKIQSYIEINTGATEKVFNACFK